MEQHPGSEQAPAELEFTPEGWVVEDLSFFQLVMGHPAPRPYSYFTQLKEDARAWRPWAFWVVGAVALVAAVATRQWWLMFVGIFVLAFWWSMFRNVVHQVRNCRAVIGVIENLQPHPLRDGSATARALVANEGQVPVALLPPLARAVEHFQGPAEVAILYSPRSQFSLVIGARPARLGPNT